MAPTAAASDSSKPADSPQPFSASMRASELEAMASGDLDVLVIGGGITGVGVALDAASRGLSVGIVERDDWACGTSSRSSKMIHGGLRYLATGDVKVVRESLVERAILQRNAAHLIRPLPMLLPVYGGGRIPFRRFKLAGGLWAYEALGHRRAAGTVHRWRSLADVTRIVPGVAVDAPVGGGRLRGAHHYHDASADDARLVMGVLRTARRHGALAANGTPVLRLLRDGDRVVGAVVGGEPARSARGANESGELEIPARVVVNATGVWVDQVLRAGSSSEEPTGFKVLPSKGIHLTVRRERVGIDSGIAFFEQSGNANVFVEPWQDDLALVGTTDDPYTGDLARPIAEDEEIERVLATTNQFLRTPLQRSDVITSWAGLRPLVAPDHPEAKSRDVSRRHLLVDRPGVLTITGGKLTAYRSMAEHAIDAAMKQLERKGKSGTHDLPLEGCQPPPTSEQIDVVADALRCERTDARHLLRRFGSDTEHVLAIAAEHPEHAERLHPERPYIAAEAVWAARYEQACDAEDVLQRRTRIALETADPHVAEPLVRSLLDRG